ncbi:UL0.7 protein [bovine alphaherpesvirus 1]|nr:UL0.7 protein [Bovine alphaherpesvirus 1]
MDSALSARLVAPAGGSHSSAASSAQAQARATAGAMPLVVAAGAGVYLRRPTCDVYMHAHRRPPGAEAKGRAAGRILAPATQPSTHCVCVGEKPQGTR